MAKEDGHSATRATVKARWNPMCWHLKASDSIQDSWDLRVNIAQTKEMEWGELIRQASNKWSKKWELRHYKKTSKASVLGWNICVIPWRFLWRLGLPGIPKQVARLASGLTILIKPIGVLTWTCGRSFVFLLLHHEWENAAVCTSSPKTHLSLSGS